MLAFIGSSNRFSVLRVASASFLSCFSCLQLFFRKKGVLNGLKKGGSIANCLNFSSCMKSSGASSMPLVCGALAPLSWHCFNHVRSSRAVFAALSKIQSLYSKNGRVVRIDGGFLWTLQTCDFINRLAARTHSSGLNRRSHVGRSHPLTSLLENKLSIRMLVQRSPWSTASHTSELNSPHGRRRWHGAWYLGQVRNLCEDAF